MEIKEFLRCMVIVGIILFFVISFYNARNGTASNRHITNRNSGPTQVLTPYQAANLVSANGNRNEQRHWSAKGFSGVVKLPRLGFYDYEEYITAKHVCTRLAKHAQKMNISIAYTLEDVERVRRDGFDRTQS